MHSDSFPVKLIFTRLLWHEQWVASSVMHRRAVLKGNVPDVWCNNIRVIPKHVLKKIVGIEGNDCMIQEDQFLSEMQNNN